MISFLFAMMVSTADAPTAPATPSAKPKKICRTVVTSESRMGKRTCKTADEWASQDRESGVKLDAINRKNNE